MRPLATTTLAAAVLALGACDVAAPDLPASPATAQTAAAAYKHAGELSLKAGVAVMAEGEQVILSFERSVTELSAGEALMLGQAVTWAGADVLVEVGPMPKGWPPPVCDEPEGASGGCPFAFEFTPDLWEHLFDGVLPLGEQDPEADLAYTFGFWHRPADHGEARRLTLENGISVIAEGDRIYVEAPEAGMELRAGEALLIGQAVAYAALDVLVEVGPMPKGWPPPVCDGPEGASGGCPIGIAAGPEVWEAVFEGEGLPLEGVHPEGEPVFSFGFWQRRLF